MEKGRPDYILLSALAILVILGILILASVSIAFPAKEGGWYAYFLFHQFLFGLMPGFILGLLFFRLPLSVLKKWVPFLLLINLVLMVMVFAPYIGISLRGASRWINLGPISFQPSEFLKLTFILYLAAWLSGHLESPRAKVFFSKAKISHSKRFPAEGGKKFSLAVKKTRFWRKGIGFRPVFNKHLWENLAGDSLIPFLIIVGSLSLLLIAQPDISTLGVIVLVSALMYFSAGTQLWHSVLIILLGLAGLVFLIKSAPYRLNRLLVFFNPGFEPMGIGYQVKQALITIGSGGVFGLGLGMGIQKFGFLPQPMSDSIFAVFAEETGFAGSLILLSVFLIFVWRGFGIAKKSRDKFSQLAAFGITSWIIIQYLINVSSMIGILPLTGIPLPFISYGGSHLVAELAAAGILLNISRQSS